MKKLFTLLALVSLVAPLGALASTTSFSPATFSVTAGQTVSVSILVTPQEAADYTAKISLSYPASLLQTISFTQSSGWLPLSQPGYDSMDNSSGTLVKTAGYSGGFSTSKVFGTVTFRAVAAGTATITMSSGTQILDANNTNTFTSGGRATVSISAATSLPVIPAQKTPPSTNTSNPSRTPLAPAKKSATPVSAIATNTSPLTGSSATTTLASTTSASDNGAAVAGASSKNVSLAISLAAMALSFLLGLFVGRRRETY